MVTKDRRGRKARSRDELARDYQRSKRDHARKGKELLVVADLRSKAQGEEYWILDEQCLVLHKAIDNLRRRQETLLESLREPEE